MNDHRPLVVAADDTVRDEILRLAAAVGCETECAVDVHAPQELWGDAPLVLVDEDAAASWDSSAAHRGRILLVCPGEPTDRAWRLAFTMGADDVVVLPEQEAMLVAALADIAEEPSAQRGHVLAVVGGRGGAGASVLAAGVGVTASKVQGNALLVDCDSLGGGVDLLLGAEASTGVRWPELGVSSGRVSMAELEAALPQRQYGSGNLSFLSCAREGHGPAASAVSSVIEAGRRAGRVVVCDLPRQLGPEVDEAVRGADLVVLVVPAEVRACVAATRVLDRLGDSRARTRVLVRGPAPDGLNARDVVTAVGAPLLTWMRPERGLAQALERGVFNPRMRSPLGVASRAVLDVLIGET